MSKYIKKVAVIGFTEVFNYAKKNYNIAWNPANDLFFGNAFEYRQMESVDIELKYLPLTVEEVEALDDYKKANAILSKFLDSLSLPDDIDNIYIDSQ